MDYLEFLFSFDAENAFIGDLLAAELAEIGFESFVEDEKGLKAYVPTTLFDETILKAKLSAFAFAPEISYSHTFIKGQNWNKEWEKNYFQPIIIEGECVIHSTFHENIPQAKYDIVIDPKMAFGTGHHETTSLMLGEILKTDLCDKSVLDMGCGTAVLAILAAKKGAHPILAIDIDEWAYSNSLENIAINNESQIEVMQGGAELLKNKTFDVIFANINRNILLQDMHAYVACMKSGSELYMSGFYEEDIPVINKEAERLGLKQQSFSEKNRWVAVRFLK